MASYNFGKETNGSQGSSASIDLVQVTRAIPAMDGTVSSLTIRMWLSETGSTAYHGVIYSDSGDRPDTLLAVTDEGTLSQTSEAPVTLNFSGANLINITANTVYWIGVHIQDPGTPSSIISYDNSYGRKGLSADTYSDGTASPFSGGALVNDGALDCYVTYTNTVSASLSPSLSPSSSPSASYSPSLSPSISPSASYSPSLSPSTSPSSSESQSISASPSSSESFAAEIPFTSYKKFLYKVYDNNKNYIKTWDDVITEPSFSWNINSGLGNMDVTLARKMDSFGEGDDVDLGNEVRIYVIDDQNINGLKIYSGWISGYEPTLNGQEEYVKVSIIGYITTLEDDLLRSGNNTTVTYTAQDPSDMIKDILYKYDINRIKDNSTIDSTGTTITYTFNTITYLQAINKIRELAPAGWYFYVDAENNFHFHEKHSTADHTFVIGKHIMNLSPMKRIENIKNVVYFVGNGIYKRYERAGSIVSYGRRSTIIQDTRVTLTATADVMATTYLDEHDAAEVRMNVRILDGDGDLGYDIETIKPGDTIKVIGYGADYPEQLWDVSQWDSAVWDYSIQYAAQLIMQVVGIKYNPDYIDLEVSSRLVPVQNRMEDIYRNMEAYINKDNAAAPTS